MNETMATDQQKLLTLRNPINAILDRKKILVFDGELKPGVEVYTSCTVDDELIKPSIHLKSKGTDATYEVSREIGINLEEFGRAVLKKYKVDYDFLFQLLKGSETEISKLWELRIITAQAIANISYKNVFILHQNKLGCGMSLIAWPENLHLHGQMEIEKKVMEEFFENIRFV